MRPLQYDLPCQLQKTQVLPSQPQHQGTLLQPLHCDNIHAAIAITIRFATKASKTCNCIAQEHAKHINTSLLGKLCRDKPIPASQADLHRPLQPLYTKKQIAWRSAILPNRSPKQHPCSYYNTSCIAKRQNRMIPHVSTHICSVMYVLLWYIL